jgi:hypothetical protein
MRASQRKSKRVSFFGNDVSTRQDYDRLLLIYFFKRYASEDSRQPASSGTASRNRLSRRPQQEIIWRQSHTFLTPHKRDYNILGL